MIDQEKYEAEVSQWFEALKDIVTDDLLRQHLNRYPDKKDFEIKEENDKISDSNEQPTVDK